MGALARASRNGEAYAQLASGVCPRLRHAVDSAVPDQLDARVAREVLTGHEHAFAGDGLIWRPEERRSRTGGRTDEQQRGDEEQYRDRGNPVAQSPAPATSGWTHAR
jgi:hypothetical protein